MTESPKFHEPFLKTLGRNGLIAAVVGLSLAAARGRLDLSLPLALVALWFSLGGHYVEVVYLNGLRPRLSVGVPQRLLARLSMWFVGGCVLYLGATASSDLLRVPMKAANFWIGGIGLIGIELLAHSALRFRGRPSIFAREHA